MFFSAFICTGEKTYCLGEVLILWFRPHACHQGHNPSPAQHHSIRSSTFMCMCVHLYAIKTLHNSILSGFIFVCVYVCVYVCVCIYSANSLVPPTHMPSRDHNPSLAQHHILRVYIVCVYVYVSVCRVLILCLLYTDIYIYIYTHTHTLAIHIYIYIYIYIHTHTHLLYTDIYIYIYIYTHTHLLYTDIYIYIYIYIYTYTHTVYLL